MIFIIHVQYGNEYENASIKRLLSFSNKISKKDKVNLLVVDNGKQKNISNNIHFHNILNVTFHSLIGSNIYNEFSGYQEGINYFFNKFSINNNSLFIFSNETFYRHRYFDGILSTMFIKKTNKVKYKNEPFLIGYNEKNFNKDCILNGLNIESHISTFFFITNGDFLKRIPNILNITKITNKISFNNYKLYLSNSNVNYQDKIYNWLFIPNKKSWYKAKYLKNFDESDYLFFEKKVYCICNEHFLSAITKQNNIKIISVYDEINLNFPLIIRFFENKLVTFLLKFGFFKFIRK
jgi:hypothetical protein